MSLRCARGIRMQFGRSPLGATRRTRWLGSNGTHNESHDRVARPRHTHVETIRENYDV